MSSAEAPVVKTTTAVGFPVFALQWQDDSTFVASGGGGPSRSGIKNKIVPPPASRNMGQRIDLFV